MLVNCPKCGLSQPKDKYCAKCGVDMDTYQPRQPSGLQKIIFSPFLHVAIVFILLAATVMFIRERRREELKARMEYLNAGPIVVERAQIPQPASEQTSVSSEALVTPEVTTSNNTETAPATTNLPTGGSPSTTTPPTPTADAQVGSAKSIANKITLARALMVYAEVDRATLNTWVNEMRAQSSFKTFDQVSTGIVFNVSQKLRSAGVKILQQVEQPIKSANSNHEWFVGTHRGQDPDNEIGFFSSLIVTDQRDGLARGDIEVQRAFRDPNDPQKAMDRISYGGTFEMPVGSGFVMRGLLPSRYAMDIDEDMNPDSFLSILKSRKFITEESEFIFILDFDSSPPANK